MRARLVVFPIKGRNWCFSRSLEPAAAKSAQASYPPPGLGDLWRQLGGEGRSAQEKVELAVDFVGDKMNRAWLNLEKAPAGSFKNKIHELGLKLLSRVKPSEIFLKSVSKDITKVDITYPSSLNPRLVRRRLRHVALRGYAHHQKYFYGSVSLIPVSAAFSVLPLPNVPFFWLLFRAYSNWRALQGSERLLLLVSDCSDKWRSLVASENKGVSKNTKETNDEHQTVNGCRSPWIMLPSEELDKLLFTQPSEDGDVSNCTLSNICKSYHLNEKDVLKYRESM
ncbi:hypothetical protein Taro_039324 [Colocasia esculenta]|uniref:Uncharacterized protein n=1 Tax=Colocasia esculenta TaxID=4460 RepID=A0A843WGC4_COLES|nr:hypothetical protein [Colocasia esculenta]